jgi:hypothetical protein
MSTTLDVDDMPSQAGPVLDQHGHEMDQTAEWIQRGNAAWAARRADQMI